MLTPNDPSTSSETRQEVFQRMGDQQYEAAMGQVPGHEGEPGLVENTFEKMGTSDADREVLKALIENSRAKLTAGGSESVTKGIQEIIMKGSLELKKLPGAISGAVAEVATEQSGVDPNILADTLNRPNNQAEILTRTLAGENLTEATKAVAQNLLAEQSQAAEEIEERQQATDLAEQFGPATGGVEPEAKPESPQPAPQAVENVPRMDTEQKEWEDVEITPPGQENV